MSKEEASFEILDTSIGIMVQEYGPKKIASHLAAHIVGCLEEMDMGEATLDLATKDGKSKATMFVVIEDEDNSPYVENFDPSLN